MTGTVKALDPVALEAAREARDAAWPFDSLEPAIRAYLSALTASASEPMEEQERHLLLRMLSAFEQIHVGQKATVELARELRAANRLIARLTAASPVPASEPEPVAWATGEAKAGGWTLDPAFIEKLADEAEAKTGYDALWEVVEHVFLAALGYRKSVPTPDGAVTDAATLKARAAAILCEVGTLCGWPDPINCNAREGAEALFNAGLLAHPPVTKQDHAGNVGKVPSEAGKAVSAETEQIVAKSIIPERCTGKSLAFTPGVLHINKDGSGYIAVNEDDWQLEDDCCEGPDGPEGSVHWITRLDASEIQALRDFLNGVAQ